MNNHFSPQIVEHEKKPYDVEKPAGPDLGQEQTWVPNSSSLDNRISNGKTDINKTIKNLTTD